MLLIDTTLELLGYSQADRMRRAKCNKDFWPVQAGVKWRLLSRLSSEFGGDRSLRFIADQLLSEKICHGTTQENNQEGKFKQLVVVLYPSEKQNGYLYLQN